MNRFQDFFLRMDARAARAVGVSIVLFAIVVLVFLLGRFVLDIEPGCAAVRACPELRVGMVLVAVGEVEVGDAGNEDTLQLVAVGARPLRLTFRPPERRTRED